MSTSAPSRRLLLGTFAALPLAALPAALPLPALSGPNPDADLIRLCDRLIELSTESCLLSRHDPHAPDEGPNHARFEAVCDQEHVVIGELEAADPPTTQAGLRAVARAALLMIDRNREGDIMPRDIFEVLSANLALTLVGDFVWPPLPGTCAGAANWFPAHVPPPRVPRPVKVNDIPVREPVDPQGMADAGMKMFGICWKNLREVVADAGRVITYDDLRAIGMAIPVDVVGAVA